MTSLCVHVESFPDKMIFYFCLILTEYYKQKNSDEFCWCVYIHHWVVIWVAALPDILISPYIAQFIGCVISMKHCGLKKGYIYSSCYYHHQIGSINLTHCYHIFRGRVLEMFVASYPVTYCIYNPGKPEFCFHHYCAVYDECKYSDTFWLAGRIRLLVHYTISLSSVCKLIWRHWTYKFCRVCEYD